MDLPGVLHPEVLARIACPAVEDEPMLVRAVTALVALTFATVGMSTPLGGAEGLRLGLRRRLRAPASRV